MWSQRDPAPRKTGWQFHQEFGYVIDNKGAARHICCIWEHLHVRWLCDEFGNLKRYGFVHYEVCRGSNKMLIKHVNGMLLNEKKVLSSHSEEGSPEA